MKKYLFIVGFILLLIFQMKSQTIEISSDDLVKLKNESSAAKAKVDSLEKCIISIKSEKSQRDDEFSKLQKKCDSLQLKVNDNQMEKVKSDSLVKSKDKIIQNLNIENRKLQEESDLNIAKLANCQLYFKYNDESVQNSVEWLKIIKSEKIKHRFEQALTLLQNYKHYLDDVREKIKSIQAIDKDERDSMHKSEKYKEHCRSILKSSNYYQEIYSKKNTGIWSIPYLDNVIDITMSIISKHNPIDYEPANFALVEAML